MSKCHIVGNHMSRLILFFGKVAELCHTPYSLRYISMFVWRNDLRFNCIQNFHLGRYIVGYMVGHLVLGRHVSRAVKCDFQLYIRQYTSPNENFEYGYPNSNALLWFCKPHKAAHHPTKCEVINDVKLFPTVYCRIYCRKFFDIIQSDVALQMPSNLTC